MAVKLKVSVTKAAVNTVQYRRAKKNDAAVITDVIAKEIATAADRYVGIHVMPDDGKWAVRKLAPTGHMASTPINEKQCR